jgi:hypothetical protein
MNLCFKSQRKHELVQAYEHIFYGKKKKKKNKPFEVEFRQFVKLNKTQYLLLCVLYSSEEQNWFCAVYVILNQTSESGEVEVVNYLLLSFLTKCSIISSCC